MGIVRVIPILGVDDDADPRRVAVTLSNGRTIRIRRALAQFGPRRVVLPAWYADKILWINAKDSKSP